MSDNADKHNLKSLASIKAGHSMRGRIEEAKGSGTRAVRLKDVSLRGGISWEDCIETELTGRVTPQWLEVGDILFAAHGSHNIAVCIEESFLDMTFKVVATPMFYILRVQSNSILPAYLAWFLNAAPSQHYFSVNAEGSRTKSVRRQVLESLEIVVPSVQKQKKIVDLVRSINRYQTHLERLMSNNQRVLDAIARDIVNAETNTSDKIDKK